jgi:aspartyl-tRNA(Asn)/glutamyl-tRNA(Gln) amidotransferase subunit A
MEPVPTIADAARAIAARHLSPVELTRARLDRIARVDPALRSFLLVTEERALADARAAEARVMRGEAKGPLDGIPIGHKDIYATAGIRTTGHSRLLAGNVPPRDATVVARLAAAGTVLLGKLATHEFAMGGHAFDLPWPQPNNPWDPSRTTAGSSSGTGAAVAAGLILGGTGTETVGSICGPAALCGVAGLKPTYGRVSRTGILPLAHTLDHPGPLAWTAEDCAILLQAMAGHDAADPASSRDPVPDYRAGLGRGVRGLRVGVVRHFFEVDNPASDATRKGIDEALAWFAREGAEVREVRLSPLDLYNACTFVVLMAEAYAIHEPWLTTARREEYGEIFRDRASLGGLIRARDYVQALRRRRELCREMAGAMADLDLLVNASQAGEAPPSVGLSKWAFFERPALTTPAALTGFPAMSVCTGFGAGGLPVAMQLIARPFDEATLLRAAHAYERAHPWRDRRPPLAPP